MNKSVIDLMTTKDALCITRGNVEYFATSKITPMGLRNYKE